MSNTQGLVQCEGCPTLLDEDSCYRDVEGCPLCDECREVASHADSCRCVDCRMALRPADEWLMRTGIELRDKDGWHRAYHGTKRPQIKWETPITRDEFLDRAKYSHVLHWPQTMDDANRTDFHG